MISKMFCSQNAAKGGVTKRTANWILIDAPTVSNLTNYAITLTTASSSNLNIRTITPKAFINNGTKQVSALVEGLTSEEQYISKITFGLMEGYCATDLGVPLLPSFVLTGYGIHLKLDTTGLLHSVDNIKYNEEILADFGICKYNGQTHAPNTSIWKGEGAEYNLHITLPEAIRNYMISNGMTDIFEDWFEPGLTEAYAVRVDPLGGGDFQTFGGVGTSPDLLTLSIGSPPIPMTKEIDLSWVNIREMGSIGMQNILIVAPIWLNTSMGGYACAIVQPIS